MDVRVVRGKISLGSTWGERLPMKRLLAVIIMLASGVALWAAGVAWAGRAEAQTVDDLSVE